MWRSQGTTTSFKEAEQKSGRLDFLGATRINIWKSNLCHSLPGITYFKLLILTSFLLPTDCTPKTEMLSLEKKKPRTFRKTKLVSSCQHPVLLVIWDMGSGVITWEGGTSIFLRTILGISSVNIPEESVCWIKVHQGSQCNVVFLPRGSTKT